MPPKHPVPEHPHACFPQPWQPPNEKPLRFRPALGPAGRLRVAVCGSAVRCCLVPDRMEGQLPLLGRRLFLQLLRPRHPPRRLLSAHPWRTPKTLPQVLQINGISPLPVRATTGRQRLPLVVFADLRRTEVSDASPTSPTAPKSSILLNFAAGDPGLRYRLCGTIWISGLSTRTAIWNQRLFLR